MNEADLVEAGLHDVALLQRPLSVLRLSARVRRGIYRVNAQAQTIGDLVRSMTEDNLLRVRNFGMISLYEVRSKLAALGLSLGTDIGFRDIRKEPADLRKEPADLMTMPIGNLSPSVRVENCLASNNIETIGQLTSKTKDDLLGIKNFGRVSLWEVESKLTAVGLSLKPVPISLGSR